MAIALGSNLGDRRAHLDTPIDALRLDLTDLACLDVRRNRSVGVGDEHGPYLNAAVVGIYAAVGARLLDRLLEIEEERGRVRPYPMAPRRSISI